MLKQQPVLIYQQSLIPWVQSIIEYLGNVFPWDCIISGWMVAKSNLTPWPQKMTSSALRARALWPRHSWLGRNQSALRKIPRTSSRRFGWWEWSCPPPWSPVHLHSRAQSRTMPPHTPGRLPLQKKDEDKISWNNVKRIWTHESVHQMQ